MNALTAINTSTMKPTLRRAMLWCIGLLLCGGCVSPPKSSQHSEAYILNNAIRPTHWDQSQWDTLDVYLKKIDQLEKRVQKLERQPDS